MFEANAETQTQSGTDSRVVFTTLLQNLETLKDLLKSSGLDNKVEIGSMLWALGDEITKTLNGVKTDLRNEAITQLNGKKGSVELKGTDLGVATINIPSPTIRVPKGKDMSVVKSVIGSDFSIFFEEVLTYKPREGFDKHVVKVTNPLHQEILLTSVEQEELTPRVSLKRNPPPKTQPAPKTETDAEVDLAYLLGL